MRTFTILTLLISVHSLAADPGMSQWPAWRGPLGTGVAPQADPPIRWDAGANVKWKTPLESRGSATPVVWGGRVFVVSAVATDRRGERPAVDRRFETRTRAPDTIYQFIVQCFDRGTGRPLWRHVAAERVPHEGHHETHSYAGSSPATDGQRLYVSFGSFGVFCYDFDGRILWQRDLGLLHTRLGWGEAVTPVVHGDALVLNRDQEADSALVCLDARTGDVRWRAERDERSTWNTPLVVTHGGTAQVIVNGTNRIRAYDLATGRELWQCGGMTANPIPSPVARGDLVFLMSGYRGTAARAIRLGRTGDLTDTDAVVWRHDRGTPYVPSPLLLGDRLWFTQANANLLTILDATNGKPILDRERLPGVQSIYASPAAAAGRVYLVDRSGTTLVLKAADQLEILATNKLGDAVDASPVLVGKELILRSARFLWCIGESN